MDWSTFKPIETTQSGRDFDGFSDWDQFTPIQPKPDQGDLTRGFKESFQQLPQLGYGLVAGAGAAAESAFGEGGIATGIKKAGVKGYEEWGAKIAKDAKPSDSWDYSYDQAKQGNFGALVDWLQHGIGYVGGQALQTLVTGGIGAVGGKFVAGTAAKQIAQGMVAKEAASIASTEAAKTLTTEAIAKLATANVASKFATLGQSVALGANAVGMEGGEVFGGLVSENKDRALTGSELGKAFAASLGAGALEFVGDKVGLDIMLGKSKLLKPAEFMTGKTGRLARGAIAAAGAAPIEAGTEYAQTLAEEYGKGKDPFSPESFAQARDAAALGALGGTVVGGAGGVMRGATPIAEKPPAVATDPVQPILAAGSVDDAIKAAHEAGQAWKVIAPTVPSEDVAMQRQLAQATANLAERERIVLEREGAALSAARDVRLNDIGQQWQALGITNPQDDLQAQRAGMRPTQDGTTVDLQSNAARAIQDGGAVATPSMDDGAGVGVRTGTNDGRLAAGGVDQFGELPTGPVATNELTFPFTKNESGTVLVTGDPAQIRAAFPGLSGVTKFENGKQTGVLFGTSAAPTVIAKLEPSSVKDNAQRANAEAQAAPVEAAAPVRSDAIATKDVPGAGSATVQTVGVDERLIPISKRASLAATAIGRNNTPISDGGKPYRTKRDADAGRKNQPMMRVQRVAGGFALVEKTPAQLAAQEKAAKRLSQPRTSPKGEPIPAHSMIAAIGGLSKQTMADMGLGDNPKVGNRRLFAAAGGLTIEQATERLVEDGYLQEGASHSQEMDLIKRSLTNPQYTPEGTERMAEKELLEREAAFNAEQEAIAELESSDDNVFDINDGDIPWDAPVSNTSTEEAMRALGFTDQEISDAIANETGRQSQRSKSGGLTDEGTTAQAQADMGSREGAPREDQGDRAEGLTSPTREDVIAQQARAEQAEKDKLEADAAAEKKAKAEREQKEIAQRQAASAENFQLGQTAEDSLSGQASIFDVPKDQVEEAKSALDAANVTGKERLDVIKDLRAGALTAQEVKDAYPGKIDDVGEKIGGARKDTAVSTGTKRKAQSEEDNRPTWAKRPFPAGEERKAMNGEFDKFIGEIKTKETDTGVAMYSRENQQDPLRKPLGSSTTVDALQAAIRELTGVSSLNKLGKIVATTASEIKSTWEPLIGKSVNIESEGDAGKAQAFYDPRSKTVFLIADHIRAGDETAVLAHDLMHKWGQQVLGKDGWDRLHNVIGTWANADKESDEYAVYNYAKNKVAAVGAELSNQELFPYAVEAAIKMGIQPSMTAARGTVARWLESVRQNLKVVWAKITGKPETFKAQDLVNLAFGIAQMENPEYSSVAGFMANDTSAPDRGGAYSRDQINTAENALRELSKIDDMFVYPKSDKTDMAGIISDNDPGLKFKESSYGNETLYKLTIPNVKGEAKIWVRKPNPYGPSVYGMDLVDGEATNLITERPGNNPEDVPSDTEDVYIDVSDLKEGDYGALIYNIAATYAHNTGRIFIGDPSGLSDIAMRRRLENMISTAIKFGTTDHIAPHPKQVKGNPAIGVPPLEWVYGDSVGNLERMIDVSLQSSKNAGNEEISYEPDAGNFTLTTPSGDVLAGEPGASAERLPSVLGSRRKGWRTAARAAIFNALLREEGQASSRQGRRDGLLERLLSLGNQRNDTTGQIFYSRGSSGAVQGAGAVAPNTKILGETSREYTAEQLRAMKNVGFQVEVPTLKERAQALWKDAGKKLAQGIADQFAPVKELDKNAYGLLRLAKGATGAFEAFLRGGKLKLTDGVYDFDEANKGGVVDRLLLPLQGEHHDFLRWVAANRAERLAGEGKENLFTAQDIADIKTLADGTTSFDYTIQTGPAKGRVTRDRTLIYADANRVFNEFNRNILDLAEQSGLIDGESRNLWEHEFYVPFYRVADEADGGIRGMNIKGGVVRQQAFKQLKGGKNALNADLLDNTLMNWAHLLDAAAKNRAAKATIEAAERMGVAMAGNQSTLAQMATSINNKNGVVWFMDGGQKRFSLVDDPYLMTAITSLEYAGMRNPVMNAMGTMKHWLTVGVTASPFFKVRNLIRDSVQAIGTGNLSFNPAKNISEGWKLTDHKSDAYFRLLAGGGTIHFGTMMEGSEAKRVQALVESGVSDSTILDNEHKVKAFYRKFIEPGITAYNELGNRGEAINRAALYNQLRKQGLSHADASLQARDLMDFSMQGSFTTIRFLTQVVPFLNARIQGLYKLGKSAKEDPARFGTVLGAATVMSIGLLAAYGDDDDWKKREEWDRNNFWWFKFGGTAFRIPKPFEIGAIATLAERGFELAFDKEMTNKRFMAQVATLLGDNLSMNPVPQLVKPILDVYSNKDSFSGRPIETMGMEKIKSEYRFTDKTSMVARALGTANNAVTGVVGAEGLSPVQIDSMLRGYFGWLGSFIVGASDLIARPAAGQADRPSSDIWKAATGGMVSDLRDAPSRYVSQMYTQSKEIEQAYGTWRALLKEGKTAEAQAFYSDNKESLAKYRNIEGVKRAEARLNERIKMIERSNMDADAKRELIRSIQQQKDRAARLVTT